MSRRRVLRHQGRCHRRPAHAGAARPRGPAVSLTIAPYLQHTNVKPDATREDIERLLGECIEHRFGGAMVSPIWVPLAVEALHGNRDTWICTALDFPMGG